MSEKSASDVRKCLWNGKVTSENASGMESWGQKVMPQILAHSVEGRRQGKNGGRKRLRNGKAGAENALIMIKRGQNAPPYKIMRGFRGFFP